MAPVDRLDGLAAVPRPGIIHLLQAPVGVLSLLTLAALAVFVAAYAFSSLHVARALGGASGTDDGERTVILRRSAVVLFLLALSVAAELLGRPRDLVLTSPFIFTTAYAGSAFRVPRAVITNFAVLAVCLATGALVGLSLSDQLQSVFLIAVVSFITMSWTRSIIVGRKLHEAQDEIARLAAADERLRIARDLHDLLGHTLSLIALKSELARHLVISSPREAEKEIGEVESTVRSTLQEVREAVAGYRRPDLARELRAAAEMLSAAGIQLVSKNDPPLVEKLTPGQNEALACGVREGVTNVIRHSRAKTCTLDFAADSGTMGVEIPMMAGREIRRLRRRGQRLAGPARAVRGPGRNLRGWRGGARRVRPDRETPVAGGEE